ncbi:MAG: hypothetical protein A3D74_05520 [Candidatus Levybacteria bacterium RIFCSPHIGHO2_02_FULL_37_13]|nr:MAG: hypothetical protein A3D74_05520 [Candidatus Levybacteria bacterium RIFCSPHIGHO2_02_FULL_37_13]OGH29127.1 MAG: hypothetical protein A3E40_03210 [Candidatus Levybacteria bacterium RIFCSPHIGHO2_12_FULL_37_9]OGH40403.1 MAG: hypothetical protein A3B41_02745 [Candidatus Levybacteria bacterium RIFCSPLOWO2_01_FULL_37_26]
MNKLKNKQKNLTIKSPQMQGEESISGSMPDLESDDDALKSAHEMGIGLSENYEHPKELDIAKDIDKAEEHVRTH